MESINNPFNLTSLGPLKIASQPDIAADVLATPQSSGSYYLAIVI